MESKHRDILQRRLPEIRQDLRVTHVVHKLIERGILLPSMEQEVVNRELTHEERADELIGLLQTRGQDAFPVFCEILQETYPHLAALLHESSVESPSPKSTLSGGFVSAPTVNRQSSAFPFTFGPLQPSNRKGPSLFIIHAGEDKKLFVRPLHKALLGQKLHEEEIFLDEVSISEGENISDKIMSTLASEGLKLVVIVMSNHLLDKYWPRLEYEKSLFHQKKFYPIWLDQNTDNFEAFGRKVGSRFPLVKKTLAHRVQYDNIAEDITDVAVKIVRLLSDQCHPGTKRKRLQNVVKIKESSPEELSSGRTDTDMSWTMPELKARIELIINSHEPTPEAAERIAEIERTLFTPEVLKDPRVYSEVPLAFLGHSAVILKTSVGSLLLILSFFRISDVDKFYHTYSRTEPGSLSAKLSKVLVPRHLTSIITEGQLTVRIHVEHDDYTAIRNRLRKGLVRSMSLDSLLNTIKQDKTQADKSHSKFLDALDVALPSGSYHKAFNIVGWESEMAKLMQQSAQKRRQLEAKLEISKHQASEYATECHGLKMQVRYLIDSKESLKDQLQKTKEQMANELKVKQQYVENFEKEKMSMQEEKQSLESKILKLENKLALLEHTEEPGVPEPIPTGDELGKVLLEAFTPLLKETVIPSNIVVHLMGYFVNGMAFVRSVLAEEQNKGTAAAMQTLLVKLQTCEQPGWFQAFLNSLAKSGYSHIKNIMEGREPTEDMTGLKGLLRLWALKLQEVVAMEMLPYLPCLSAQNKEQIEADNRTHGNSRALITLIDCVSRCGPGWYTQFLEGLRRNGHNILPDMMGATFGLDQETIHGKLETHVDTDKGKILIKYNGDQEVVNTVGRFVGKSHTALGDVLVSGGKMYWEVDVRNSNHYRIGVAMKTVKRDKWIGDTRKSWCIRNNDGEVSARHNYVDSGLRLVRSPPVIGVLLDYDNSKVYFFDADSGKHLHTYEVDMTEPLRPAFQVNEGYVVVHTAVSPAKMEELLASLDAVGDYVSDFTPKTSWRKSRGTRFLNDKRLADLSKSIGREWRQVASCLGLENVQLDKLEINHPRDHNRQVLEGLSAWRLTMKDDDEMLAKLSASLQECSRSDIAEKIQEEYAQH